MKKVICLLNLFFLILFACSFEMSRQTTITKLRSSYNSDTYVVNNVSSYERDIKQLLTEAMIDKRLVDNYGDDTLADFEKADKIYITNSQIASSSVYGIDSNLDFGHYPDLGGAPSYKSELTDSYMKITYVVIDYGDKTLKFSVDAVWNKMPVFRMLDSLGSIAMNCTVINDTRKGYFDYEINNSGELSRENIYDFENAINGNWYGSACKFWLTTWNDYYVYTKFNVHYEYEGHFNGSFDNPYINTTATYGHQRIGLSLIPSLSINLSGKAAIGLGFGIAANYEYRIVEFPSDIKVSV